MICIFKIILYINKLRQKGDGKSSINFFLLKGLSEILCSTIACRMCQAKRPSTLPTTSSRDKDRYGWALIVFPIKKADRHEFMHIIARSSINKDIKIGKQWESNGVCVHGFLTLTIFPEATSHKPWTYSQISFRIYMNMLANKVYDVKNVILKSCFFFYLFFSLQIQSN